MCSVVDIRAEATVKMQVQDDTVIHVWKWWWPTDDPPTPVPDSNEKPLYRSWRSLEGLGRRLPLAHTS